MELREWLFRNRIKITVFSKGLGYTREYISNICNDKSLPSVYLARKISAATNGEVSMVELLKIDDNTELPITKLNLGI